MMTSCLIPVIVWPAKHLWSTCNNAIHVISLISLEKRNDWDVYILQTFLCTLHVHILCTTKILSICHTQNDYMYYIQKNVSMKNFCLTFHVDWNWDFSLSFLMGWKMWIENIFTDWDDYA